MAVCAGLLACFPCQLGQQPSLVPSGPPLQRSAHGGRSRTNSSHSSSQVRTWDCWVASTDLVRTLHILQFSFREILMADRILSSPQLLICSSAAGQARPVTTSHEIFGTTDVRRVNRTNFTFLPPGRKWGKRQKRNSVMPDRAAGLLSRANGNLQHH